MSGPVTVENDLEHPVPVVGTEGTNTIGKVYVTDGTDDLAVNTDGSINTKATIQDQPISTNATLQTGSNIAGKVYITDGTEDVAVNTDNSINTRILDANGNDIKIDGASNALQTIDYGHHEIHSGSHFFNKDWTTLGNGASYDILFVTPNTTKWGHLVFVITTEAEANMIAYVNTTTTDDGTAMSVFNRDGNSAITNTGLLYHTPTIDAIGSQVARYKTGSGKSIGGEARTNNEIILKQNTKYLFRITNDTVSNNWIDWLVDWYEHTNL